MTDRSNVGQLYKNFNPNNNNNIATNKFSHLNSQQQQIAQNQQQQHDKPENDKAFLDRTNVNTILSKLIESLNYNEPEDPIGYICNYFDGLQLSEDQTNTHLEKLQSISYTNPIFDDCCLELYTTISKIKSPSSAQTNQKKQFKFQLIDTFNSIIDTLTEDLMQEIRESLLLVLKKRENDYLSFDMFRATLKLISLLREYINQSTLLFNDLEMYSANGKVSRQLCELLIEQLRETLNKSNCTISASSCKIESLYLISPTAISTLLNDKYTKLMQKNASHLTLNEFLLLSSKLYLDQLQC